ncbi:hypothetical protein DAEQUDRAFT_770276 [Daedalea quercina L-15889]|uniref:Uncharacterized protein n=1 Tax=Daedalea quercina L-15889 TaxID=1314783 RepID=A0A165KZP0_9APHY|nr:hypothetical protein DAEQUDRAFT_770276 [Daedalea quercina L-15889]
MTPTVGRVSGPATPSQPHASPPSDHLSNPAPPEEQQHAAPPQQNVSDNRSACLLNQWDPAKHAHVTFGSLGKHFAELARVAEAHLARELGEVKAHAQHCEKQFAVALAGAKAERQAADAARAAEAEVRGNMLKAYAAATQLSGMCGGLRGQLRTVQAELEQARAERESLREENWQLKEVVAKLSRDVHLGERERREGSSAASGDALLDSALAQAREECEKRVLIERELTELKAHVSKQVGVPRSPPSALIAEPAPHNQALLQSSATDTSWPEIVATFPRLEVSFANTQPVEQREPDNCQGGGRTPPPLAGQSFTSGLATPQSQAGTVDIERPPSDRAASESEVIDLTMSDDSPSPPAANGRKRSASPSLLDEESALKRRRVQELIDGPPPRAEESPPEMRPSSSSSIHEFGVAPLLMGTPAHEDLASSEREEVDPDQTLVDESGADPASLTVPKLESKVESREEGEILGTPTEVKPVATLGEATPGHRDATLPEQVPSVHQLKDEEEEDGEIKQETQASPPLPSALTPTLPIRSLPVSTVKALPASREQRPSTSSDRTVPLLAPRPPPESHALPPKPNVPPPPLPRNPPPPRPALRRTLTISHINLAYHEVGPQYTCVMCKRRHSKDPTFRAASFPKNSSWDTLAGHVEREHPMGFERLVNMSAGQIAEAISRK